MAEPQELAKLHDIHLPAPISWWPLAPGWYLLLGLALLLLGLVMYLMRRAQRHKRAKLQALQLLRQFEQEYQNEANSQQIAMKVSELLRRVALAYYPRTEVAGLQGDAWLAFLTKTSKGIDFNALDSYLLVLPYQPARSEGSSVLEPSRTQDDGPGAGLLQTADLEPLFLSARQWIKQRGLPCSN